MGAQAALVVCLVEALEHFGVQPGPVYAIRNDDRHVARAGRVDGEMQGYFFSTPVAAQDFAELLRSHTPKPLR